MRILRRPVNLTDLIAGGCVIALSAGFMALAVNYGLGSARRMGPGFYPFALSLLGMALGAMIVLRALIAPSEQEETGFRWRPLIFVAAAFVLFGLMIERGGLLATIVATTVVGSLADPESRLRESLPLGIGLALGIWAVFVALLGLSIPVLPRLN